MKKLNAIAMLFFLSLCARAEGPYASDADLRAGFCFEFVKSIAEAVQGAENLESKLSQDLKDLIGERRNQMAKLQRYLIARNQAMNADSRMELIAATKSGRDEYALYISQIEACIPTAKDALSHNSEVCTKKVRDRFPIFAKCEKLDFLPY